MPHGFKNHVAKGFMLVFYFLAPDRLVISVSLMSPE
ncbi:hypothetical protein swp_3714 [Shewanella piezotolerans WP3]|uniref:Uncharacterized protein n=1 Tax=Shewanella piezotolerans (strain WP3 / JCM 13877) TaxID=225849 RepID=B8CSA8_SHEPW|nr:hypothetical protein swp_3714 [Shewanella piezotolerans WP3]